jgi:hypothetical protein
MGGKGIVAIEILKKGFRINLTNTKPAIQIAGFFCDRLLFWLIKLNKKSSVYFLHYNKKHYIAIDC